METLLSIVCLMVLAASAQAQIWQLKPWQKYVIEQKVKNDSAAVCSCSIMKSSSLTDRSSKDDQLARRELFRATHPLFLSTANQQDIEQRVRVSLTTKQKQKIINKEERAKANSTVLGDLIFDVLDQLIFKDE